MANCYSELQIRARIYSSSSALFDLIAGFAATAHDQHPDGAVDFFCLPTDPEWSAFFNDGLNSQSYLFGVEFKVETFDPFSHENAEFLDQRSVPCAVCRVLDRGTQLLFPAKLGCPANWTEEYRGSLMSGNHDHAQRSQAVCVDEVPEVVSGGRKDGNGALFYIIEGRCTSGLCPRTLTGERLHVQSVPFKEHSQTKSVSTVGEEEKEKGQDLKDYLKEVIVIGPVPWPVA
ncbi:uncharacterized protein LOC110990064 [Acanthaster planci]|uniref:Uncharacterized protein LOC110990064 n=1 Tax=Acanthaster planci TaxID=133434 RepID=A0A8B7ZZM2_ACAPL|nr:uncharacterized protein LOC110990064 [Acanthaster planci]